MTPTVQRNHAIKLYCAHLRFELHLLLQVDGVQLHHTAARTASALCNRIGNDICSLCLLKANQAQIDCPSVDVSIEPRHEGVLVVRIRADKDPVMQYVQHRFSPERRLWPTANTGYRIGHEKRLCARVPQNYSTLVGCRPIHRLRVFIPRFKPWPRHSEQKACAAQNSLDSRADTLKL